MFWKFCFFIYTNFRLLFVKIFMMDKFAKNKEGTMKNVAKSIANQISKKITAKLEVFMILGSGWREIMNMIQNPIVIPYKSLKGMPLDKSGQGQFVIGYVGGKYVCIMHGRLHMYEGYDVRDVVLPIDIMNELGVESVVITNSSGGINKSFEPGDVVVFKNHVNFTSINPLVGAEPPDNLSLYVDMSKPYDEEYIRLIKKVGCENNIPVKEGVYVQVLGPTYETEAEVKMFSAIGVDMIGCSTVAEITKARYYGMKVLCLTCITNKAAGLTKECLSREAMFEIVEDNKEKLKLVLIEFLKKISN